MPNSPINARMSQERRCRPSSGSIKIRSNHVEPFLMRPRSLPDFFQAPSLPALPVIPSSGIVFKFLGWTFMWFLTPNLSMGGI